MILLWVIAASGVFPARAFAAPRPVDAPPGFRLILSDYGVELYQKDYPGGNPDYVQVINLELGAAVYNLHGAVTEPGIGGGVYGGDNPSLERRSLQSFWQDLTAANPNAFCVTNGQFFLMADPYTTPLPFPLKKDGVLVSDGYGINEFPDRKLILELWPERADIQPLTPESLAASTAPNVIAGLDAEASKRIDQYVGRTFVGVDDQTNDGAFETVLIFNSLTASQADAAAVLRNFGADKVMMLDGGGSTQIICQGSWVVQSDRLIPQALGVSSGTPPALAAAFSNITPWSVLISAQPYHSSVTLTNTGSEAWLPEHDRLVVDHSWGDRTVLLLERPVQPGETITLAADFVAPNRLGAFTVQGYMARDNQAFSSPAVEGHLLIIPPELADRKGELLANLEGWQQGGAAQTEQAAAEWIRAQSTAAGLAITENLSAPVSIDVRAVLVIPLLMLPVIVVLVLMIGRMRAARFEDYE